MGALTRLKEIVWPSKGVGLPLYLEEGGNIFGYVTRIIKENERVEGYEVTVEGGISINIPADSVVLSKKIVIYRPKWYVDAIEFIRRLEAQKTITPELRKILDGSVKPKDTLSKKLVSDGMNLYKDISDKLIGFLEERGKLKEELEDITHRRILGMSSGGEYAKNIIRIRKRMELLDANIRRAEEVLRMLDYRAFREEEKTYTEMRNIPPSTPAVTPEEKTRIKKLRVLKIERDLMLQEEKLKKAEEELRKNLAAGGISYELNWIEERLSEIEEEIKSIDEIISSAKKLDENSRKYLLSRKDSLISKKKSLLARKEELQKEVESTSRKETERSVSISEESKKISEKPPESTSEVEIIDEMLTKLEKEDEKKNE